MVEAQQIKEWIEQGLPHSKAAVEGDGRHFEAVVVAGAFEGLSSIARHRLVYQALGDKMADAIHALSLKTITPSELENH